MREPGISRARLESLGAGRFRISGVLDASTAREVLEQSEARFAQLKEVKELEIDLGGVAESDSAGLALLIEWLRMARQQQQAIRFSNVPAQIEALARISEVEDLIDGAEKKAKKEKKETKEEKKAG